MGTAYKRSLKIMHLGSDPPAPLNTPNHAPIAPMSASVCIVDATFQLETMRRDNFDTYHAATGISKIFYKPPLLAHHSKRRKELARFSPG